MDEHESDGRPGAPRGFTPMSSLGGAAPPPRPPGPTTSRLDPLPTRPRRRGLTWLVLGVVVIGVVVGVAFLVTQASDQEAVAPNWGFLEPDEHLADLTALCRDGEGIAILPAYEPGADGVQAALLTPQTAGLVDLDAPESGEVEPSFDLSEPALAACMVETTPLTEECQIGLAAADVDVVTGTRYTIEVVETRTGEVLATEEGEIPPLGCPSLDPVDIPPELLPPDAADDLPTSYDPALVDELLAAADAAARAQHSG